MRKPLDDSRYLQKRWSENGPYFVILDPRGHELATSRVFRNDAWYAVGCELLRDVPDAEMGYAEEAARKNDSQLRSFTGILIKLADDGDGYQFAYITVAGRALLTSAKFSSRLKAERAADVFQKVVYDIVERSRWAVYAPS